MLLRAVQKGHTQVVNRLLDIPGVDATTEDSQVLIAASRAGYVDIVDLLLSVPDMDAGTRSQSPLMSAIRAGHLNVVNRLLADPGVDPTILDSSSLVLAAKEGHLSIVDRLLQEGVDPTAQNCLAFQVAVTTGQLAIVERLLQLPCVLQNVSLEKVIERFLSLGSVPLVEKLLRLARQKSELVDLAKLARFGAAEGHVEVVECLLRHRYHSSSRASPDADSSRPFAGSDQAALKWCIKYDTNAQFLARLVKSERALYWLMKHVEDSVFLVDIVAGFCWEGPIARESVRVQTEIRRLLLNLKIKKRVQ
eukprot:TRINITY_DN4935_c0_g2_i1.p1 TRINITY_DN4935_c0_g2~~TRINITY_DN4935_c0_g2_i1.p1  ORF type:complete len:307 (+),score=18.76 TRINITY_DN4935_c0_g2_i1:636-1556(+)